MKTGRQENVQSGRSIYVLGSNLRRSGQMLSALSDCSEKTVKKQCVYMWGGAWRNENISVEAALHYANEQLCTVANCTFDAFTSCFFSVLILQNFCSTSALIDVSVSIPLRRKLCGGRERLRLRRFAPPGERRTKRRTTVQSCKAKTLCKHIMVLNVA